MTTDSRIRAPRVFEGDDPAVVLVENEAEPTALTVPGGEDVAAPAEPFAAKKLSWASILLSALGGLILLSVSTWAVDFALSALRRGDWIGQIALGLVLIAGVAAAAIMLREFVGLLRLARLSKLRREIASALDLGDVRGERAALRRLVAMLEGRADLKWPLARYHEHEQGVPDPGDLSRLAERELIVPLDRRARRLVIASAKRVSLVTAISPIALIDVLYVLGENLRLLRALATLYGGRPGTLAALRLGRMVLTHMVATGGLALTDDLLGQVLGHDLIRRLSRRLGEGAFNGAMTARIGAAAIQVTRPLPFIEAPPVRARDFVVELFRKPPEAKHTP
jgi:putative membrane protein